VGSENDPQDSRAWPVLASLGKEPMHMGAVGTAAATKLALNQLIASLTVSAGFQASNDVLALQMGCYAAPHLHLQNGDALCMFTPLLTMLLAHAAVWNSSFRSQA